MHALRHKASIVMPPVILPMNLTAKQKRELSKLLLECATMQHRDQRDAVISYLPMDIKANIKRNDADNFDVANIVDTCLRFANGLEELIDSLEFFERNSLAMQMVLQFLANQIPDPAPKPEPIPPSPKPDPISLIDPAPKPTTPAFTLTSPNELIWAKDGKAMVRVPAGEFLYGDDKRKMELPEFWIDKTPVTNAEYARFVAETDRKPPSHWKGKIPPANITTHPVVYVNWHDAVAYAEWAGKQLPPEEYWEKAARGTDGRKYPWGDNEPTDKLCNFNQGFGKRLWSLVATTYYTTPVGQYSPQGDSPYGCVDMAGNVKDWTASLYQTDNKNYKILRNGSWFLGSDDLRCALLGISNPSSASDYIGFRCFCVPIF